MKPLSVLSRILLMSVCTLALGCQKRVLEEEVSLEDAAKMLIEESARGKSIYGGALVASDTMTSDFARPPPTTRRWTAQWDFLGHTYNILYDTVIDREVPLRGAIMSLLDSAQVSLDVILAPDNVIHKTKYTTCRTSALLVQLGRYGDAYHGWVLRKIRYRRFLGPTMMLAGVTVQRGDDVWPISDTEFGIDSVLSFSSPAQSLPGDSITVRAKTSDPTHLVFLNVADAGTIRRIPMIYNAQRGEFAAGWRISASAVKGNFYQAVVEAYTRTSLTSPVTTDIAVSGQTFVYKIN